MPNDMAARAKTVLRENRVIVMFAVLCILGINASGLTIDFVLRELVTRIGRNTFTVLSLIVPVIAGMGLNFGIVIGAMAAQLSMVIVTHLRIGGISGILLVVLIATPLAVLFGFLVGNLMNKTKGQEMIASLFMGFFTGGIYQFIMLVVIGGIIPIVNPVLLIQGGVGVKNTVDLVGGLKYGVDDFLRVPAALFFNAVIILIAAYILFTYIRNKRKGLHVNKGKTISYCVMCALGLGFIMIPRVYYILYYIQLPALTFIAIGGLILFNGFLLKTRLGQNMRTVGQSRVVANAAGLNVNKIRIIAIIISTVFASWGQIISLQNLGALQTYFAHEQVGLYAIASLLVGGATVHKARNSQAVIGVILFHTLFIIAPFAGKNLFHSAQIGEYFRVAVAYAVIAVSLMMYAVKSSRAKK